MLLFALLSVELAMVGFHGSSFPNTPFSPLLRPSSTLTCEKFAVRAAVGRVGSESWVVLGGCGGLSAVIWWLVDWHIDGAYGGFCLVRWVVDLGLAAWFEEFWRIWNTAA